MSDEARADFDLEIAHVLFIDTVGYSKLSIAEQRELFDQLNRVVRASPQFRASEAAGKLIRLPTGDGMALLFSDDPQAPARCAIEITRAVRQQPSKLPLRMGIHSGPVSRVVDVNDRSNAAGAGINIAQRVMSCGDSGHILLSKRVSEDLAEYSFWRPYLHDLGECEVKHGTRVGLVNLYLDDVGNSRVPARLQEIALTNLRQARRSRRKILLTAAAAMAMVFAFLFVWKWYLFRPGKVKSIAVLPFKNFGNTEQNAMIADGLHDEILTDLSKVADLKVISRTSVMQYRQAEHNLREIAKQLGVANIVEGSVQFFGDRVKVTAQLIDARTDTHIWADKYEGNLADVFALEGEVAEKIVSELRSRLSSTEKAAIEQRPTSDLAAYDLYLRGKDLIAESVFNPEKEKLFKAIDLLQQALARDQSFALAYYQLAHAHDQIYVRGFDHSSARLALADEAIRSLQHLRPDSGEAHLALAKHLYWGYLDYDHARQELLLSRRTLPNEPLSYLLLGYIDRRQGRWNESIANMEYALELDPRNPQNVFILQQLAKSHECLRNYPQVVATLRRALAIDPKDAVTRVQLAKVDLDSKADPKPLHREMQAIVAEQPDVARALSDQLHLVAMCERDPKAASAALATMSLNGCHDEAVIFPREWCEGQVARLRGDLAEAHRLFAAARAQLAATLSAESNSATTLCALGVLDAALGNKEQAVQEGRDAVSRLPVDKDSVNGALLRQYLVLIYAWVGETDAAIEQLDQATKLPGYLSYGQLRLDPLWDPLRNDPRFERITASLAPR